MSLFDAAFKPVGSTRRDPVLIALWLSLVLLAVIWILPFVFIVFTSLKDPASVMGDSAFSLPKTLDFTNYVKAWDRGDFATTVVNSTVIAAIKVPLGLFLSAMAAFALACVPMTASRFFYLICAFGTLLPFQVMLAPIFRQVNAFGLINTYPGIILPYLAFGVPYQVFILYGFFRAVPKELSEAARIDGASYFTIFRRIYLPVSLPALAALFIIDFVATWNEFAMALVILQSREGWTLPLGLMNFQSQFGRDYGQLNAAIVMTVLPAAIIYLMFQRYFVSGLTTGAVKE